MKRTVTKWVCAASVAQAKGRRDELASLSATSLRQCHRTERSGARWHRLNYHFRWYAVETRWTTQGGKHLFCVGGLHLHAAAAQTRGAAYACLAGGSITFSLSCDRSHCALTSATAATTLNYGLAHFP